MVTVVVETLVRRIYSVKVDTDDPKLAAQAVAANWHTVYRAQADHLTDDKTSEQVVFVTPEGWKRAKK